MPESSRNPETRSNNPRANKARPSVARTNDPRAKDSRANDPRANGARQRNAQSSRAKSNNPREAARREPRDARSASAFDMRTFGVSGAPASNRSRATARPAYAEASRGAARPMQADPYRNPSSRSEGRVRGDSFAASDRGGVYGARRATVAYVAEEDYASVREPQGLDETRFGGEEFDQEEMQAEQGLFAKVGARIRKVKRSIAKSRAGKDYMKRYGGDDKPSDSSAGPRAAVYKGEMGSQHRRATRMQDEGGGRRQGRRSGAHEKRGGKGSFATRLLITGGAMAACVAFCAVFLYGPAQQYYQEIRELDRLRVEYAAVLERNEAIADDVAYLSTDEGIEDRAREEFGWIKAGENAVKVLGLEEEAADFAANILSSDIDFPETWYSKYLDPFFGVE